VQFEPIDEIEIAPNRKPLPDQELVFNSQSKLNSVPSTRRSGKTTGIVYYGSIYALQGKHIAICYPTYDECAESFILFENGLEPFLASKNGINKRALTFRLLTGGSIRFFSYEAWKKIRGKKFHYVFCDEFQECQIEESNFTAAMYPTLSDYSGKAFFFGTPKKNTLIEVFHLKKEPEWNHLIMKATNNPRISQDEIEFQRRNLPPLVFAQEWEGEFVDFSGSMWLYEFKKDIHLQSGLEITPYDSLHLSFDFNNEPCTCLISQKIDKPASEGGGINFIKEFAVNGGTRPLCNELKKYLDLIKIKGFKSAIWVTGDNSGTKHDTRSNTTDYQLIRDILGIPFAFFIDTRKANPRLTHSRNICNIAFYHNLVFIDPEGCPILAADCAKAKPKEGTDELIKDRVNNKNDSMDAFRYDLNAWFKSMDDIFLYSRIVNGNQHNQENSNNLS